MCVCVWKEGWTSMNAQIYIIDLQLDSHSKKDQRVSVWFQICNNTENVSERERDRTREQMRIKVTEEC